MQRLRKSSLYIHVMAKSDKNHYFNANTKETVTLQTIYGQIKTKHFILNANTKEIFHSTHTLFSNQIKIVTLSADTKEITLHSIYG